MSEDALVALTAAVYYAFLLFGSVSLGYAFLRFTQPEVRAMPKNKKLAYSLGVGAAFVLAAIGIDYASYGERVFEAQGLTPLFALAATLICLLVFKAASALKVRAASTRTMEVAVAAPPEKEGAARLLPFVQEVRKFDASAVAAAATSSAAPATQTPRESEEREIQQPIMQDAWSNKPIEEAAPETAPQTQARAEPAAPPWVNREALAAPQRKSVRDKLADLKARGVITEITELTGDESRREKTAESTEEKSKPAMLEPKELEPKPIEVKTPTLEKPVLETPKLEKLEAQTPKTTIPTAPRSPPATTQSPSPSGRNVFKQVFGTPRYAKKTGENEEEIETIEAAPARNAPARAPAALARAPALAPVPRLQAPPAASGAATASATAAAAAAAGTRVVRLPPASPARGARGAGGEEKEIEVILSELHLVTPPKPAPAIPPRTRYGKPAPAPARQAAAQEQEGAGQAPSRHRLYLERRAAQDAGGGQSKFDRERAEKQELNELFTDVYAQMEKPGKPGAARQAAQRGAAARAAAGGEAEKALSVSDLFGGEAGGAAAKSRQAASAGAGGGSSVFAQLDALDASGKDKTSSGEATQAPAPQVQVVKMKVDSAAGCPHCGAKNVRVVFCPYCGSGMCANCTPNLKPGAEAFVYTCPKCGEEVPVAREKKA